MKLAIRLLSTLKPYRLRLAAALACGVIVTLLTASYPLLIQPLLDDVFIRKDRFLVFVLPPIIMGIALLKGFFSYGESALLKYIGNKVISDIRAKLYHRMILLPIDFHQKNPTGNLLSYLINDVNMMQTAVSTVVTDILRQGLTLIALTSVIFYQNFTLALLGIVVIPPFIIPLAKISERLRKVARTGQERMGDLSAHLQETFSGVRVIKAFCKEEFEADRFEKKNEAYLKLVKKGIAISEIAPPLMETCGAIGVSLIIWYAGISVIEGAMTPGSFFSFLTACMLMYRPLKVLSSVNNQLQQALSAAERVFSLWDEKNEQESDRGLHKSNDVRGELTFQNVSFAYDERSFPALRGIDFKASPGDTIALVGHSGAGKSTLINLIPRFYEPTEGEIRLDGIPLLDIALTSLREKIGIVSQEVVLFDETIGWNIAYGASNPSKEEVKRAAEIAYADLFIRKMEKGYETFLEKGGGTLSGGERQRLAIARAVLKNPPILILDEATSALDSESEFYVQMALGNLMKNRTTLVIAHRLSTVLKANCIIVMERGRIVEMGRHEELIQKNGFYKRLYEIQFRPSPSAPSPAGKRDKKEVPGGSG